MTAKWKKEVKRKLARIAPVEERKEQQLNQNHKSNLLAEIVIWVMHFGAVVVLILEHLPLNQEKKWNFLLTQWIFEEFFFKE